MSDSEYLRAVSWTADSGCDSDGSLALAAATLPLYEPRLGFGGSFSLAAVTLARTELRLVVSGTLSVVVAGMVAT